MKYYDLHIHSALSPCSDDDMTIHNIIQMSLIKELNMISITDHNSLRQYESIQKVSEQYPIDILIGCEIQTKEDIHVLCYFKEYSKINEFQEFLMSRHPGIQNKKEYFGNQYILDELDNVMDEENLLLLVSLDISINELCRVVHEMNGKIVLAHVLDRGNSIITQLGFIPPDLNYDAIEVKNSEQRDRVLASHPWISKDTLFLYNSDAHHLIDIHEAEFSISEEDFNKFWR